MKAQITMKNRVGIIEYENNIPTSNFIKEIETCKKNNNFWRYQSFILNPLDISIIEIIEDQTTPILFVAPPDPQAHLTEEEKRDLKQPYLKLGIKSSIPDGIMN